MGRVQGGARAAFATPSLGPARITFLFKMKALGVAHHFPLSAISSAISFSLMPTMASPKSSESLAMSFASV